MCSGGYDARNHAGLWASLDELPVAAIVQDPDQVIRWLNPPAAALLGIPQHTGIGRTCQSLLKCSECAQGCAAAEARERGQARAGFGVRVELADGTTHSLIMDAVPIREQMVVILLTEVTADGLLRALDLRQRCREIMKSWVLPPE